MMSSNTEKTREEILAERQERKKKKAALRNQPKGKPQNSEKPSAVTTTKSVASQKDVIEQKVKQGGSMSTTEVLINALQHQCKINESVLNDSPPSKRLSNEILKGEETRSWSVKKNEKLVISSPAGNMEGRKFDKNQSDNSNKIKEVKDQSNKAKEDGLSNEEKVETKSKAQLKAERRAKQEAERAKKLEKAQVPTQEKKIFKPSPPKLVEPIKVSSVTPVEVSHKVKLFAHLYYSSSDIDAVDSAVETHPSIIQLGAQYSSKVVTGANACCLALLNTLKKVVMDFETPQNQEFSRGLEAEITKSMSYLSKCRPVAVSMVNAVKHLKFQVSQSKGNELECKNNINEWIDTYIKEQLEMAAKAICLFVREKITPGDVILTYGCSSLIQQILISVHNEGINFQVIVVDGRPWLEGREMLKKLVSAGIRCTYVFVNGLSFIMPEVTKILLGAHALLANGYVMSRVGSSQIALLAKTYNVPVLVCCETHKFSERVQTDSFVYNELGNPDELASSKGCLSKELSKWKSIQYLTPLNLTYDVTPPDLVSAVVTEIAVLPCTSVPVILRIKPPDVSC